MKKEWERTVITEVGFAVYVEPSLGKVTHKDRPKHGFVLNDDDSVKDYYFSDGRVMRTEGRSLFYLPRGSSYSVKVIKPGGCYAINFEADIEDEPFSVKLKSPEKLRRSFKLASDAFKRGAHTRFSLGMRALYDAVYHLFSEGENRYFNKKSYDYLGPALSLIEERFTDRCLTVSSLARLSGISEVYFRRLFKSAYGTTPVEYINNKRLEYARGLLLSGDFEVRAVAEMSGYAEPCHFSREFSKRFGFPPSRAFWENENKK